MPPRERLFPQPATRPSPVRSRQRLPSRARSTKGKSSRRCGKTPSRAGHDFQTLRKNSVSRRARLPDVAQKLRFVPGFGKGTSSTRAVTAAQSTAASSRWGECCPANAFFRSLLRGRVLSAPGSGFRLAPVPRRARLPDVAEKLRSAPGTTSRRCPKTPFRAGFGKGTSSTRAVTAAQSTAASSRWGNAARETAACSAAESCPLPAAASVSRPFREGHDFQTLRKAPFRAGFWEGHEFQLPKNSVSRRFWEGHEFHSCRNRRPINSGFQPLGECCPANAFFPSLLRGRVLSAPGSGFRLAPVPRRARLPDVAESSVSRRVLGRARVPVAQKLRLAQVLGRARVPLVP